MVNTILDVKTHAETSGAVQNIAHTLPVCLVCVGLKKGVPRAHLHAVVCLPTTGPTAGTVHHRGPRWTCSVLWSDRGAGMAQAAVAGAPATFPEAAPTLFARRAGVFPLQWAFAEGEAEREEVGGIPGDKGSTPLWKGVGKQASL